MVTAPDGALVPTSAFGDDAVAVDGETLPVVPLQHDRPTGSST